MMMNSEKKNVQPPLKVILGTFLDNNLFKKLNPTLIVIWYGL